MEWLLYKIKKEINKMNTIDETNSTQIIDRPYTGIKKLLNDYAKVTQNLSNLQIKKEEIEVQELDPLSKDTLTKQYNNLKVINQKYKDTCDLVISLEAQKSILNNKISMTKAVASMFDSINDYENFVESINQI